jgi:hypothetical protein
MKKIITIILIAITALTGSARADSYVIPGMWIGAGTLAGLGTIGAISSIGEKCQDDCDPATTILAILGFGVLGGLIGAGIGASIPRHDPKISFTPTIAPTKDGLNVGGNLAVKF